MHFPFIVYIGHSRILLHTITEPLAMFIGFRYYVYLKNRQGDTIHSYNRIWIIMGAAFGALIGSRLIGGLENTTQMLNSPNRLLYFYSNKTVLGGLVGALFFVEITKLLIKERQPSGDLFTYPMMLALIIGRMGCFSMGVYEETYGTPTSFFTGINLGDGQLRHPVSLYEIAFLITLWVSMLQLEKRYKLAPGALFKVFMIAYCNFRFLLDFIKPRYTLLMGLSTIQLTALFTLIYYYPYILQPRLLIHKLENEPIAIPNNIH